MADSKLTALAEDTAPDATDIIYEVQDPAGTPASKKVQFANIHKAMTVFTGDSGAGGIKGLVPAPAAGDAAAEKYLMADGSWTAITIPPAVSYDFLSTLTSAEIALSVGGTATISRAHTTGGTTAGTLLLPAASGNTGKFLSFRFTNTAITTLDGASSETIDSVTTRPYYQNDSCVLYCDGSNWHTLSQNTANLVVEAFFDSFVWSSATSVSVSPSAQYNFVIFQTSGANGTTMERAIYINKGTYTASILGATNNINGKLDWTLNGVSQTTGQDWYSASAVYGVTKTFTLTVPYTGLHRIKATINGSSGAGYYALLTKMTISPAAY